MKNQIEIPQDEDSNPCGAIPILIATGNVVFFDRRIWHAAGDNRSTVTRKSLFYGYSYRWLQSRDEMTVEHLKDRSDPIRHQLLGATPTGKYGYTSPKPEDIPLRAWIEEHLGMDAVVPGIGM